MTQNPELAFAVETVKAAGEIILSYYHSSYVVQQKGKDNPVTSADLAADSFLREKFAERFPSDGWLSEESLQRPEQLQGPRIWVVDPLDGTKEFVKGLPEFAVSVALLEENEPALAVVYNPPQDELFVAERGKGSFYNGDRVVVSKTENFVAAEILASRSELSDQVFKLPKDYGSVRKTGSIAYKLALIASNRGDITISFRPKNVWDVCGGTLLVEEAGGRVTDFHGEPLDFRPPYRLLQGIIAANPVFHRLASAWVSRHADFDK
jgi:myo-inositol-1(or 4)-monophosphatase